MLDARKTIAVLNAADKADLVNGKVPAEELPSYVDDVVEYANLEAFPEEGESGKIYIALDTGYCYRWSGSMYVQINAQGGIETAASFNALPQEGEVGIIYITEDDNKQYRWTGAIYAELSVEDQFEVVSYQTETALTDAQIRKALEGKLIVTRSGAYCYPERVWNTTIFFRGYSQGVGEGVNVPKQANANISELNLDTETKMFSSTVGGSSIYLVRDASDNFAGATEAPSGNKIMRGINLAKTQAMFAPEYSNAASYSLGACCIHENSLYCCSDPIVAPGEEWNSQHWIQVQVGDLFVSKQDALVSGTNIKTVNNQSILGAGNLDVGASITVDNAISSTSENPVQNKVIYNALEEKVSEADTSDLELTDTPQATGNHLAAITIGNDTWRIDDCPATTDGTFVRKCVVTSGVPSYSWVAE